MPLPARLAPCNSAAIFSLVVSLMPCHASSIVLSIPYFAKVWFASSSNPAFLKAVACSIAASWSLSCARLRLSAYCFSLKSFSHFCCVYPMYPSYPAFTVLPTPLIMFHTLLQKSLFSCRACPTRPYR